MDTRKKILETADRLFRERGYKGVTMEMLAAQVGISKKTLYQHFENKTDLVEFIRQNSYDFYNAAFNKVADEAADAIEAFLGSTELLYEISSNSHPTALYELERYFPQVYASFRHELLKQSVQITRKNMERGIAEGLYRSDINLDLLSYYRVETALMSMRDNTLMFDSGFSLGEISRHIGHHFLCGLLSPAGTERYQQYKKKASA